MLSNHRKKNVKSGQNETHVRPPLAQKNATQQATSLSPVVKKPRTAKKGRTVQRSAINKQNRQSQQKEASLPRFTSLDKINDLHTNPAESSEKISNTKHILDKSTPETDTNANQFGKGTSKAALLKSKGGKLSHIARASRATNWLKILSERTSMLDKSNPQWKVLEMKLDKGNGSMTVRVMKEDDHVSVAVNFTDPEVKALAETQYNEILKDLEDQYQQEVKFTFNGQGHSSFESFSSAMPQTSKSRPALQPIEKPVKDAAAARTYDSPDSNVWIG